MLPGGQCRLDRFGFGCLSTVKNPIVHPLPLFGPKGPPSVKKRVGRPDIAAAAAGCTGKGQPCDVGAQRPLKAAMKKAFDEYTMQVSTV